MKNYIFGSLVVLLGTSFSLLPAQSFVYYVPSSDVKIDPAPSSEITVDKTTGTSPVEPISHQVDWTDECSGQEGSSIHSVYEDGFHNFFLCPKLTTDCKCDQKPRGLFKFEAPYPLPSGFTAISISPGAVVNIGDLVMNSFRYNNLGRITTTGLFDGNLIKTSVEIKSSDRQFVLIESKNRHYILHGTSRPGQQVPIEYTKVIERALNKKQKGINTFRRVILLLYAYRTGGDLEIEIVKNAIGAKSIGIVFQNLKEVDSYFLVGYSQERERLVYIGFDANSTNPLYRNMKKPNFRDIIDLMIEQ